MGSSFLYENTMINFIKKDSSKDKGFKVIWPKSDDYSDSDENVYNGLKVEWDYRAEKDGIPEFNIKIYGLSQSTAKRLTVGQYKKDNKKTQTGGDIAEIYAGYGSDIGLVARGEIKKIKHNYGYLELQCYEVALHYNKTVSLSFSKNTKTSTIIQEAASKINHNIKKLELTNDYSHPTGYSAYKKGLGLIKELVEESDSYLTIKEKDLYITKDNNVESSKLIIGFQSGLLKQPEQNEGEDDEYNYEIETLLIHYLKKKDIIELESYTASGDFEIISISINDFKMRMKVKAKESAKKNKKKKGSA